MSQELKALKKGDKFFYKNVGYGAVTYEEGNDFSHIEGERLFTRTFDSIGFQWGPKGWFFDSGLGLVTFIVPGDDPAALKFIEEENF